ncbi:glycosyltransferase [Georgenia sp. MJ206]|uniref:glycosyltransferase n=1 Tax=Georgenia wangjunii TaxID=3117730 RepID=UPI002F26778A
MWTNEAHFFPSSFTCRDKMDIPNDHVTVLYAGALGSAQGLETFLDAVARVGDLPLTVLIAGGGTESTSLQDRARALGLKNVLFLGPVPAEHMSNLMAAGDIHLVSLGPGPLSDVTLPSKLQATMASGRPILAIGGTDLASTVRAAGAGYDCPSGAIDAIAATLRMVAAAGRPALDALGENAREYYDREFSARVGVDRVERILREAVNRKGSNV